MSTLKRSLSNLPQDNLMFFTSNDTNSMNDHHDANNSNTMMPDFSQNSHHLDLNNYVSANQSQESFAMSIDDYYYMPSPVQPSLDNYFDAFDQHNYSLAQQSNDDNAFSNVFNTYGNPNTYTTSRVIMDDLNDHQLSSRSKSQTSFKDHLVSSSEDSKPSSNVSLFREKGYYDELGEDILMVPQDTYEIYGHQELNDFNSFHLNNDNPVANTKDWSSPNDLNFIKADNIMYDEFSEDEEDEDDWDTNKLEDTIDFDDSESHASLDYDDRIVDDYINEESNDIYSPANASNYSTPLSDTETLPNVVNPADLEKQPTIYYEKEFIESQKQTNEGIEEQFCFNPLDQQDEEEEEDLYTTSSFENVNNDSIYQYHDILPPAPLVLPSQINGATDPKSQYMEHQEKGIINEPFNNFQVDDDKVLHERSDSTNSEILVQTKRVKKTRKEVENKKSKISKDCREEDHYCLITNPKTGKPCNKRFSRPYDLVRHQNTIHAKKRSFFRCLFCEDDLRRRNDLEPINDIVKDSDYRKSALSLENSQTQITSTTVIKKLKSGADAGQEYMSNKTFSRCDALTRHLRFRHGLSNKHVVLALDFAKSNVEFYEN